MISETELMEIGFGSTDPASGLALNAEIEAALCPTSKGGEQHEAAIRRIIGIRPKSPLEGLLSAQIVVTHTLALREFARAADRDQPAARDHALERGADLSRSCADLPERSPHFGRSSSTSLPLFLPTRTKMMPPERSHILICPLRNGRGELEQARYARDQKGAWKLGRQVPMHSKGTIFRTAPDGFFNFGKPYPLAGALTLTTQPFDEIDDPDIVAEGYTAILLCREEPSHTGSHWAELSLGSDGYILGDRIALRNVEVSVKAQAEGFAALPPYAKEVFQFRPDWSLENIVWSRPVKAAPTPANTPRVKELTEDEIQAVARAEGRGRSKPRTPQPTEEEAEKFREKLRNATLPEY